MDKIDKDLAYSLENLRDTVKAEAADAASTEDVLDAVADVLSAYDSVLQKDKPSQRPA